MEGADWGWSVEVFFEPGNKRAHKRNWEARNSKKSASSSRLTLYHSKNSKFLASRSSSSLVRAHSSSACPTRAAKTSQLYESRWGAWSLLWQSTAYSASSANPEISEHQTLVKSGDKIRRLKSMCSFLTTAWPSWFMALYPPHQGRIYTTHI